MVNHWHSWYTYRGNIRYTSGGAGCPAPDTSHLFPVQLFPPLPILRNVAFLTNINTEFHCIPQWYVLSFTCTGLQRASVLQAGIIFQAIIWLLFFLYSGTKGTPLGSKCDKTHSQQPRIWSYCTFYAHQTIINWLVWHCSLTVLVFYQEKNWLCWKYVINHEVRSAIFGTLRSVE